MTTITTLLALTLALALIVQTSHAQSSPQDYVDAHNEARAEVGVGNIEWNDTLAAYADQYATKRKDDCALILSGGPYGEALAWSSALMSGTEAVQLWVDQKKYYDYESNSCVSGNDCLGYTQVVWGDSIRLGCARVACSFGGTFVVCNYDPRGNILGERPY